MIKDIAYQTILGLPIVAYGGMLTLILIIFVAYIGMSLRSGKTKIPYKYHPLLAKIAIALGLIHMFFALSIYLNY